RRLFPAGCRLPGRIPDKSDHWLVDDAHVPGDERSHLAATGAFFFAEIEKIVSFYVGQKGQKYKNKNSLELFTYSSLLLGSVKCSDGFSSYLPETRTGLF